MPNPYSYKTFAELKTALSQQLADLDKVFWIDVELGIYLNAALREWNAIARMFRDRGTFDTAPLTPFYDLRTELHNDQLEFFLAPTVTDDQLLVQAKYMLMEPNPDNQTDFTECFLLADFTNAFANRRNQFLMQTGLITTQPLSQAVTAGDGRVLITDDTVIDVRRAAWDDSPLFREDEFTSFAFSPSWRTPGVPQRYSLYPDPLLNLQLIPPPATDGTLSLLTISSSAQLLDDFTPFILWGVLADVLTGPGAGDDPMRSQYAEARFQEGILIGKMAATVLQAYIDDDPVATQSVFDLDAFQPDWGDVGTPSTLATIGANLVAVAPQAASAYTVTIDAIRNAPQMVNAGDSVPIGREYLNIILDYANHLAVFKQGGADFQETLPLYDSFVKGALAYNARVNAQNLNIETMLDKAQAMEKEVALRPQEEAA